MMSSPSSSSGYKHSVLPFPKASNDWYRRRGELAGANEAREKLREVNKPVIVDGEFVSLYRSRVTGTLDENIKSLEEMKRSSTNLKKHDWETMIVLANTLKSAGSLISTNDLQETYYRTKGNTCSVRTNSGTFYETKHVLQIYIRGKAYIIENTTCSPQKLIETVTNSSDQKQLLNSHIEDKLKDIYPKALQLLHSEHDRQILKAILAEITSNKFTAKLQGVQNRLSVAAARASIHPKIKKLEEIQRNSQTVSDMTVEAQRRLIKHIIEQRKIKEIRQRAKGAGRCLKSVEFPELPTIFEFAFGEHDAQQLGRGD